MKIVIVGCGAHGGYHGACLARAGHDTHFLLRSDHDTVLHQGFRVISPGGDFTVHPRCARDPREIGLADLVIIGLKTTANSEFPILLPPLVGPHTAVLTLQNGLGNEETLSHLFPTAQILGGLCFVCLNRTAPGVVHHLAHGRIVLGEFAGSAGPRTHALAAAFRAARVPCEVTNTLGLAHWQKLVWNIPFNGLGVAGAAGWEALQLGRVPPGIIPGSGLSSDRLIGDPRWLVEVLGLMREVIQAARGRGFMIPDSYVEFHIERTRDMGPYRPSTLVDFEERRPLELESLFLEPLRQARAGGVETKRLARLCGVLKDLAHLCEKGAISGG